jgi:thioesterase domain-containing protein/acyl-CoA synthetase (AMP-forming)/AMP-acid ligase II
MHDQPLRRYLEVSRQPAGSAFHTSQVSISFGEIIDAAALRAAWEAVAQAHVALQTRFQDTGAVEERKENVLGWQELDWQSAPPDDLGAAWQALVESDAATPIAVAAEPLVRVTFIRLPNGGGHALWSFHAALLDDDSISAVLHEWLFAYDALRAGGEAPAFEPPAVAENPDAGEDAWKPAFEGFVPPHPLLVLPLPEHPGFTAERRSISHTYERPERTELAAAAKAMGADLRALAGAAWAFVLSRATTSPDTLLLEPYRASEGIGRLETFVAHRCAVEACKTSGDLARAFAAPVPPPPADPSALSQALGLSTRDVEPATAFVFRERTLNDRLLLSMPRWMAADVQLFQKTPAPITLRFIATDRPEAALDYDPGQLSDGAARLLFEAFRGTLAALAADPALPLSEFALPGSPAELKGADLTITSRSLVPQTLHELLADIAAEAPDTVAVEMAGEMLTCAQLHTASNQLARLLRKRGVEPGRRVGIAMSRSPHWIVALLGTLKAGAVIVPLDEKTKEPAGGISAWIVDALAEGETRELPVVQMQIDSLAHEKVRGLQNEVTPASNALACIDAGTERVFTHEALIAAFQSTASLLELTPSDRVLQFAPTGGFAAVEEAFSTLLAGATVVMSDQRWATRTAFQEFVQDAAITALSVPAPFWSQWTHYLLELSLRVPGTLRLAVISGEWPSPNALQAWAAVTGETRLLRRTPSSAGGGPGLSGESSTPSLLGRPMPATQARLVDSRGLIVPLGLPGNVEITAPGSGFIPIGIEAVAAPEGILHDRALLQAGTIGLAPEAIAIRFAAATHPDVIDAWADQRLIAARPEWCVWVVPRDSQRGEPHDLREWLAARLSSPPRRVRALPRLPLDETGQIDTAALAELLPDDGSALPARKGSPDEERLRLVISRALGGRRIELDEILTDGRTKSQVAKHLLEAVSREEPRVELSDFTSGFSVRSLLRNVRGRESGADSKWTPLQPLRASGKLPPLVFVHDFDGAAKLYAPLVAQLGANQPCYAITARGLVDPAHCHTSVQEMARAYVEALRVFDQNGPYRLVGYGFGGLVAFEMARQLAGAGASVPLLVLLATEPTNSASPLALLSGGWKRALPAFFGKKPVDDSRRRRAQENPVYQTNQEAARNYTAAAAPVVAHIFAPEHDFPPYRVVQSGWSACCKDAHFYQVPCSGPEMMDEPAVEAIASAISKLARAEDIDGEVEE